MKKWINSPWVVALGSGIILFALPFVFDLLRGMPIFSTVLQIYHSVIDAITVFVNIEIRMLWIIVVIIFLSLIVFTKYLHSRKKYRIAKVTYIVQGNISAVWYHKKKRFINRYNYNYGDTVIPPKELLQKHPESFKMVPYERASGIEKKS